MRPIPRRRASLVGQALEARTGEAPDHLGCVQSADILSRSIGLRSRLLGMLPHPPHQLGGVIEIRFGPSALVGIDLAFRPNPSGEPVH